MKNGIFALPMAAALALSAAAAPDFAVPVEIPAGGGFVLAGETGRAGRP